MLIRKKKPKLRFNHWNYSEIRNYFPFYSGSILMWLYVCCLKIVKVKEDILLIKTWTIQLDKYASQKGIRWQSEWSSDSKLTRTFQKPVRIPLYSDITFIPMSLKCVIDVTKSFARNHLKSISVSESKSESYKKCWASVESEQIA